MIKFQPTSDHLLLESFDDNSSGGLVIADDNKRTLMGKVVAVGTGRWEPFGLIPVMARVGDTVFYPSFSKQEIRLDGKLYVIVSEKEIFGIVRNDKDSSTS